MVNKVIIMCILGMLLLSGMATLSVAGKNIIKTKTSVIDKSNEFYQDATNIELCPLEYTPLDEFGNIVNINYSRGNLDNPLILTNNPSNHKLVLEPPWDGYNTKEVKDKWGVSDCWAENTEINGECGTTTVYSWAGPGAGGASISKSLRHYDSFRPPKNGDYSFTYKFKERGSIKLDSMFDVLGSSAARGGVNFYFYLWDGKTVSFEKSMTVKDQYAIGGVGNGEYSYTITKTYSNSARLKKDVSYTFGAYGIPWVVCDGFVIAHGSADQSVDWAGLQKMEIEWPNSPPNTPELLSPSNGATGVSRTPTLKWTCSDPDGRYDSLKYDVYFGKTSSPPLKSSGQSAASYRPGTLEGETTYYWKIVVKDSKGEAKASQVWKFSTEKEGISNVFNPKIKFLKGVLDLEGHYTIFTVKRMFELFDKKLLNLLTV